MLIKIFALDLCLKVPFKVALLLNGSINVLVGKHYILFNFASTYIFLFYLFNTKRYYKFSTKEFFSY